MKVWVLLLACASAVALSASADEEWAVENEAAEPRRRLNDAYTGSRQGISEVNPLRLGIATGLVMLLGSLAAGAGIGGGGLFVPIYWLVLGVGPKGAVPLSGATILGGAIGNFVSIGWQKHPKANRPLIDYEAAVFTQPGELLGVVFGVLLNIILPQIAIVALLAIVLSYNARRTLKKAFATRAKEDKQMTEQAASRITESPRRQGSARGSDELEGGKLTQEIEMVDMVEQSRKPDEEKELREVLKDEATQFPIWVYATLIPMTAYLVVYKMLSIRLFHTCKTWEGRNRGGEPRGWARGVYWLWYWTPIIVYPSFWVIIARIIYKRSYRRNNCPGYVKLENDLVWDEPFMRKFPAYALTAGCLSGLLGIGGGMILGPIFMAVDMEPRCATSASAFSILWTAGSGTILWVFGGNLNYQLLIWMMSFGFISGQIGQRGVDSVLHKTNRPSYLIFLLGSIISLACLAMVTSGIATITLDVMNGREIFYLELAEFKCGTDRN